jgi:RNA polymerase sigma factor (sigma-70 family)
MSIYDYSSDEVLIERFKEGDEFAFDLLVRRYEQKVYQLAYRLTNNPDDAADVAAEAFLRMYNSLKRFRGDAQLSTWLYRVVSNVFFDFRKREARHQHLPLEMPTDDDDEPYELPIEDESVDIMGHALQAGAAARADGSHPAAARIPARDGRAVPYRGAPLRGDCADSGAAAGHD